MNHDVRIRDHNVACLQAHQQEDCGLHGRMMARLSHRRQRQLALLVGRAYELDVTVCRHELRDHQPPSRRGSAHSGVMCRFRRWHSGSLHQL